MIASIPSSLKYFLTKAISPFCQNERWIPKDMLASSRETPEFVVRKQRHNVIRACVAKFSGIL